MKIQIPTNCPCCDYPLELVTDQLFCRNSACGAQLSKKLEHFAKTLGIKGLGPKTVEKLNLSDLTEIFYLDLGSLSEVLGDKTAIKLLNEIESAKQAELATVIASFAIPLIGDTASSKICSVVSHIDEITLETCKEAGLGEKATANLINWLNTEFLEIREFLPFSYKTSEKQKISENALTICITGKLKSYKTKAEAYSVLNQLGYRIVESVTKTLDILVDEEGKNSTKRQQADKHDVTIVTNLMDFINNQP